MEETAVHITRLTRHLWETYWVKDVVLGTGNVEMSNVNSFILSQMRFLVRIIIAHLLTRVDRSRVAV